MVTLPRDLRSKLQTTVRQARRTAEDGAAKALAQLGVGDGTAPGHLGAEQRALRNRLRAHGRQLGDRRERSGVQSVGRLTAEVAYEHWHRMLFARFLAENDLLIDDGLALTLSDVQELAREAGGDWLDLAATYAQRMLPEIFRRDDPALAVGMPLETRSELEDLLKDLAPEVFRADDSLGWVYQFWQAERKEAINASGVKIGADELPAVTQLFTEDYMVLFLLHNTLGAWWAARVLAADPALARDAADEAALRAACALPGVEWTCLRFVREPADGSWRPAAGSFSGWPKAAKEITLLDPCMGSGHFLVFALPILVALRMAEEGLDRAAAVTAVLRDNLFGLEIDPRCTQIAAFNLAFAAWRMLGGHVQLPALNLACSGLAVGASKEEWLKLADRAAEAADPAARRDLLGRETTLLNTQVQLRMRTGLERLYDLFAKAPWLGSLIDPRRAGGDIFAADYDLLAPLLSQALYDGSDDVAEMAVAAQGLAKAAELLAKQYVLVATNVPYLGRGKQDRFLRGFLGERYSVAKGDVAVAFMLRTREFSRQSGSVAIVTPQSWLFLGPYRQARVQMLESTKWNFVVQLGAHAFETITGEVVNVALCCFDIEEWKPTQKLSTVNLTLYENSLNKDKAIRFDEFSFYRQELILEAPDSRFSFESYEHKLLSDYAASYKGVATGDLQRFGRKFWESLGFINGWSPIQTSDAGNLVRGGRSDAVFWERGSGDLFRFVEEKIGVGKTGAWLRGSNAWEKRGITIGQMSGLAPNLFDGDLFDENTAAIIPRNVAHLSAIYAFCSSREYSEFVRSVDASSLKVPTLTLLKVPFDLPHWQKVAIDRYPDGLPKPHSDDPTQWLFNGHPRDSDDPLQVAVARLAGYRWPRQTGSSFMDCPAIEEPDGLEHHADADGIVCLSPIMGEAPAGERLARLLADAYGADWTPAMQTGLLERHGQGARNLDEYLRDRFFARHLELFQNRPFVWHLWDGRRDGFHVLVNYHRLAGAGGEGRRVLEKLIYTYLREWIDRQALDARAGVEGADGRLAAAAHLRSRLQDIVAGAPPFDVFVRWKPLHAQPVGWEPGMNDGVRMNIRPFMTARPLEARAQSACILRVTPRIKWDKDRGTEPMREKDDFPWFWGCDGHAQDFAGGAHFDGNRWNDLHYSLEARRAGRARKGGA